MSSNTQSYSVFFGLPLPLTPVTFNSLQAATQSFGSLRSTCPNHINLRRLTTSDTSSMPKLFLNSTADFLSFSDTPHMHHIIILSVLSNFGISSTFIGQLGFTSINHHTLHTCCINLSFQS